MPTAVYDELIHADAPALSTGTFLAQKPTWLDVRPNPDRSDDDLLDFEFSIHGERAAIALAALIRADLILMDDRAGVAIALRHGLIVTGTLGVLDLAARHGLVDLAAVFAQAQAHEFSLSA